MMDSINKSCLAKADQLPALLGFVKINHLLLKSSEADEEMSEEKVEASCIAFGKGVFHV